MAKDARKAGGVLAAGAFRVSEPQRDAGGMGRRSFQLKPEENAAHRHGHGQWRLRLRPLRRLQLCETPQNP